MATFEENAQLTLKMLPTIQQIITPSIWDLSDAWLDRTGAVDMVLRFNLSRGIALRTLRCNDYNEWDFTIRSKLRNGCKTEYHKFRDGCADMMFFGVLNQEETAFIRWMLISLDAWRLAEATAPWGLHKSRGDIWNKDKFTAFRVYSAKHPILLQMPEFMIDCHDPDRYPGRVASRPTSVKRQAHLFANDNGAFAQCA